MTVQVFFGPMLTAVQVSELVVKALEPLSAIVGHRGPSRPSS